MSANTLLAFSLAALLLVVIPGPAVMYIVTRSATQGRRAGLVSVAGIHIGTMVHVVAAMVGLSAILAASATAFTGLKLIGAGYPFWLGVQSIRAHRSPPNHDGEPSVEVRPLTRVFADGVILNILNPKTALFFLSFVPQFIDSDTTRPVLDWPPWAPCSSHSGSSRTVPMLWPATGWKGSSPFSSIPAGEGPGCRYRLHRAGGRHRPRRRPIDVRRLTGAPAKPRSG